LPHRPPAQPSPARPLAGAVAALGSGDLDDSVAEAKRLLAKYAGGGPAPPAARPTSSAREAGMGNGIYSLLLINFALFAVEALLHQGWTAALALNHYRPVAYQFLTAAFVHANWEVR
jgi:hypothetical protein